MYDRFLLICVKILFLQYYFHVAKSQMARWQLCKQFLYKCYWMVLILQKRYMALKTQNGQKTHKIQKDEKLVSQNNR